MQDVSPENAMTPNHKYINGSWYDWQYGTPGAHYHKAYIEQDEPQWARECDRYLIHLIAAIYALPLDAKILDCGSGVGQMIEAWHWAGYNNVRGIELSKVATDNAISKGLLVSQGTVADMHMFEDKAFDIITSVALLEHIDASIEDDVVKEMYRLGKRQAHTMAQIAGTDPSHINIKPVKEWLDLFIKYAPDDYICCSMQSGPLMHDPLILIFDAYSAPQPLKKYVHEIIESKKEKKDGNTTA